MFVTLFEMGYAPLALVKNSKRPIPLNWDKYSKQLPDQSTIEIWQKDFTQGKINIGVVCGKASNIIALDIDLDDQELFKIIPPSPIRKRGGKGEVRFFRYSESQFGETRHFTDSSGCGVLDVLSDGTQTVLPPSIHPETGKSYEWLTPDTLFNTKASDLPALDSSWLEDFKKWLDKRNSLVEKMSRSIESNYDHSKRVVGGRNNKLKEIVTAMRARGCEEREVIDEIYNYDLIKHSKRLFTDKDENKKYQTEEDAYNNAARFYASVNSSLISKGIIKYQKESKEIIIDFDEKSIEEAKKNAFKMKPYPKPRGMMKKFYELCDLKSSGKQDATALGGALALMSILAANKFKTECRGLTTCPNLYIINLGYSGTGKEMAQSLIYDLLIDSNLIGSGNYKSDASILMGLPEQQERIDIIDECSSLLAMMGSKESYRASAVELLSELYSKAATKYNGQSSLNNGKNFGACWNPHVTILGSTTPNGFRNNVNKDIAAKGFLPRLLLFFQEDVGDYKGRNDRSRVTSLTKDLKEFVNQFLSLDKIVHPDFEPELSIDVGDKKEKATLASYGTRYAQRVIPFTDEAMEEWLVYEELCHNKKRLNPESFESAFIARFAENVAKVALLDSLSLGKSKIDLDSLQWAINVIETQWHNSAPLYEIAHAENRNEASLLRILGAIRKHGVIERKVLYSGNRWLKAKELDEIILMLDQTGQIEVIKNVNKVGPGRPTTFYQIKK